jgi:hypothetical protein
VQNFLKEIGQDFPRLFPISNTLLTAGILKLFRKPIGGGGTEITFHKKIR